MRWLDCPGLEVRADKSGRRIRGLAAVYYDGTPATEFPIPGTDVRERVLPGAFERSLEKGDIKALYDHNRSRVLGSQTSGTLTLSDLRQGLEFSVMMPDHAADVLEMVSRGDVDGASFGFNVPDGGASYSREGDHIIRSLENVDLKEISITAFPAYDATAGTVGVRARGRDDAVFRWLHSQRKLRVNQLRAELILDMERHPG